MEPDEAIPTGDDDAVQVGAPAAAAAPPQEAIPTGDDNSIATPPLGKGDSGGVGEQPEGQQDAGVGTAMKNIGNAASSAKAYIAYLLRRNAAPPQVVQQAQQQVPAPPNATPSDRNLLAIKHLRDTQGDEAASKAMETNALMFQGKQSFGYVAATGSPQKPADLNAAIKAANQASEHVLDGSNVQFAPSQNGVTATVKTADGKVQQYPLSIDQFKDYLNPATNGMWDKLMQPGGIAATLQKISSQPQAASATQSQQAQPEKPENSYKMTEGQKQRNYGGEAEARADAMFGRNGGMNIMPDHRREAWLAQQDAQQQALENKKDVATIGATSRVEVQNQKSNSYRFKNENDRLIAMAKLKQAAASEAAKTGRTAMSTAQHLLSVKLANPQYTMTDEDNNLLKRYGVAGTQSLDEYQGQGQQAAPPAGQQTGGSATKPPVPGARIFKGQWYIRGPNNEPVPYRPQ
jgi:hypothetical protein